MRRLRATFAAFALALALPAAAHAQGAFYVGNVIDGPSPAIGSIGGLDLASDGNGALVYVKQVGGIDHVFASRFANAGWQPPEQLDAGLAQASSQPVVAAGQNGLLLAAFANNGSVYVTTFAVGGKRWSTPTVAGPGSNPAIAASIHDKGYLVWTAPGPGGHDVDAAYWHSGRWAPANGPLDGDRSRDAGVGTARPAVAAAGDGEAIATWGEGGHVYARRIWATSVSSVFERADTPTLGGGQILTSDLPVVATEDTSSFADIAYRAQLSGGDTRVVLSRLRGSQFEAPVDAGATGTPASSTSPALGLTGAGHGFVAFERPSQFDVWAAILNGDGGFVSGSGQMLNGEPNHAPTFPAVGVTGQFSGLVAWQHDPGSGGAADIRGRFYDSAIYQPEGVISRPELGNAAGDRGLFASGDRNGNVAVAFEQTGPAGAAVLVGGFSQPPAAFSLLDSDRNFNSSRPVIRWRPSFDPAGIVRYEVRIDGVLVATTATTQAQPSAPLRDGIHRLQVTAFDSDGRTSATATMRIRIDTVAPTLKVTLRGARFAGNPLTIGVATGDRAPASGVASVLADFGDGRRQTVRTSVTHAWSKRGSYKLRVVATDRAGNRKTIILPLRIA